MKKTKNVSEEIAQLSDRLREIEDMILWGIRCDSRFKVGQRVQISSRKKGRTFKGGVTRGTVKELRPPLIVSVLMDGYKHPMTFHHNFFDKIGGSI